MLFGELGEVLHTAQIYDCSETFLQWETVITAVTEWWLSAIQRSQRSVLEWLFL